MEIILSEFKKPLCSSVNFNFKRILFFSLVGLQLGLGVHAQTYTFSQEISGYTQLPPLPFFETANKVASSNGYVYTLDQSTSVIHKFDSTGILITKFGSIGSREGQFLLPNGIAVDNLDNLWVLDAGNFRVQKFDAFGTFIGAYTPTNTPLVSPQGIAVDNLGFVYIIDSGGQNGPFVLKLDGAGNEVLNWSFWNTESTFSSPVDIALDPSGNVYVADNGNVQIEKFDPLGNFIKQFDNVNSNAIGIDQAYNIYTSFNDTIYKYDSTGAFIRKWGGLGKGSGAFSGAQGIAIDVFGKVYVMDVDNYLCQKFDSLGNFVTQWGSNAGDGQMYGPSGIGIDALGYIYVSDTKNARVQKFNSDGSYNLQWTLDTPSGGGKRNGQAARNTNSDIPIGIAVSANGNIFVLDSTYSTISEYDSDGGSVSTWSSYTFVSPKAIALDLSNNVYVSESANFNSVSVYDNITQNSVRTIGQGTGTAPGFFSTPWGVAVDNIKNVYVADFGNHRIQKFDSLGNFIKTWGNIGIGDGNFLGPKSLAIDASANIYVVDAGNNRIQKFDSAGTFLEKWGTSGELDAPWGIAVNSSGAVYVSDFHNDRIQVYTKISNDPIIFVSANKQPIYPGQLNYLFGSSSLLSTNTAEFTIYNFGAPNSILQLGNSTYFMTVTGVNASEFVVTPPTNVSIAAGDSVKFTVSFVPGSLGNRIATLEIPTNDPQALNLRISLGGAGRLITQTIVGFGPLVKNFVGNPPIILPLVASSGLDIIYNSSNTSVASISGNSIIILSTGTSTITASQPGNTNFSAAPSISQTLTIESRPIVSFTSTLPSNITFGTVDIPLSAVSSDNSIIVFESSNSFIVSITGSNLAKVVGTGTVTISAYVKGTFGTPAYAPTFRVLTVDKASQTVSAATIPVLNLGASYLLSSTATSGLPVSVSVSGTNISVNGLTITPLAAGASTITFFQLGDNNYNPAIPVSVPVFVSDTANPTYIVGRALVTSGQTNSYALPLPDSIYRFIWSYSGGFSNKSSKRDSSRVLLSFEESGVLIVQIFRRNGGLVDVKSKDIEVSQAVSNSDFVENFKDLVCLPQASNCSSTYISSFSMSNFNNVSTGCSNNGYTDYTGLPNFATLKMGNSYSATVTGGSDSTSIQSKSAGIWIDYNNDGNFYTQDGEFVGFVISSNNSFSFKNIVIRNSNLYQGLRRLRVRIRNSVTPLSALESCQSANELGETEDYKVELLVQGKPEAVDIITPNGDGKNDLFLIKGIDTDQSNQLVVVDQWGVVKFKKEGYSNDWGGTDNNGSPLKEGTYFYSFTNGSNSLKGFLEIKY